MSLSRLMVVMRARWRAALLVIAGAVTVAVLLSVFLPRQYRASASVLVDMRSPDPLMGTVLGTTLITGYMATQMDVVQSERVVRRAIESLALAQDPAWKERWMKDTKGEGDFQEAGDWEPDED